VCTCKCVHENNTRESEEKRQKERRVSDCTYAWIESERGEREHTTHKMRASEHEITTTTTATLGKRGKHKTQNTRDKTHKTHNTQHTRDDTRVSQAGIKINTNHHTIFSYLTILFYYEREERERDLSYYERERGVQNNIYFQIIRYEPAPNYTHTTATHNTQQPHTHTINQQPTTADNTSKSHIVNTQFQNFG
jgi:hypothetical protein